MAVYAKLNKYQPCPRGQTDWTAGPKIAYFDRVEWNTQPDPSTAANALTFGEMDWWENPTSDLMPLLKRSPDCTVAIKDPIGECYIMRPDQLFPPFDNPVIRRALMGAINQKDFMTAMMGNDTSLWKVPVGYFPPGTPLASSTASSSLPTG